MEAVLCAPGVVFFGGITKHLLLLRIMPGLFVIRNGPGLLYAAHCVHQ